MNQKLIAAFVMDGISYGEMMMTNMATTVNIGTDIHTGRPVSISGRDRQTGLYIVGKPGSGKTTLLESLVLQDIANGDGVCLLDPSGDLVHRVLRRMPPERLRDVVLADAADYRFPFALNPFFCRDPSDPLLVNRIQGQFVDIQQKLWGSGGSRGTSWGPLLEDLLRALALTFIENQGNTMAEITRFLSDPEFRSRLTANITNPEVQMYWQRFNNLPPNRQREEASSTENKIRAFLTQPLVRNIVGQAQTSVDFRSFMDKRKIVLVPLRVGMLGPDTVQLLGSLIVLEVLNAALSREDMRGRSLAPFKLYADEYQRFASESFAILFEEARKYEVSLVVCHQNRSGQLDQRNKSASLMAGNLVVFAVEGSDAEELAREFDRTPPPAEPVGERQAHTIAQEPLQYLARNGHSNGVVRELIARRVAPLMSNAFGLPEGVLWSSLPRQEWATLFFDEGSYYASRQTLQAGVQKLNAYLVELMEGRRALEQCANTLFDIVFTMRAFFRVAPYEEPVMARPFQTVEERERFQSSRLRHVGWIDGMGEQELQAIITAELRGNFEPLDEAARYSAKRVWFWEAHLQTLMGRTDPIVRRNLARQRASFEGLAAVDAIKDLIFLGALLMEYPILVESGQWTPILDRPRTYGDVEGEIASRLANQPQFHAICKVVQSGRPKEFEIMTGPYFELQDEAHSFATALADIQSRSRRLYCRPREEVEAEISARGHSEEVHPRSSRAVRL